MSKNEKIQERTLIISRKFKASAQAVFDAWTKADQFSKWMGPGGYTVPECNIDLKAGGHFRAVVISPEGGENIATGTYEELAAPDRLVFTFGWNYPEGRGHVTAITVELAESGGETEMTMHQALFAEAEHRDQHNQGWNASFDKMAEVLS